MLEEYTFDYYSDWSTYKKIFNWFKQNKKCAKNRDWICNIPEIPYSSFSIKQNVLWKI